MMDRLPGEIVERPAVPCDTIERLTDVAMLVMILTMTWMVTVFGYVLVSVTACPLP